MSVTASPTAHKVHLIDRGEVAERTMAFWFEKPAGFTFTAGQFVDLTLVNPPETDVEGNTRAFSIASPPHEARLMVATRLRNTAFKRVLRSLSLGASIKLEGPFGNLSLHSDASRPAVLVAGGIGITPFRSMLIQAAKEQSRHRIFLFYSNRRPEDAPFLEELENLQRANPNYTFTGTMTGMQQSSRSWKGETGRLNENLLMKSLKGLEAPIYYIVGPPGMVHGSHTMLTNAGIPRGDIRTEEFAGY